MKESSPRNLVRLDAYLGMAILVALAAAGSVLAVYFAHFPTTFSAQQAEWGQFGDYVGGLLNPFFSVMAFFALLYTVRQQSITIDLQVEEMRKSTEQLENSANALREQNRHNERQQFDARLFHLMSLHVQAFEAIKVTDNVPGINEFGGVFVAQNYVGSGAIHFLYLKLLDESFRRVGRNGQHETVRQMEMGYIGWANSYRALLSRYLGSLANIVRFIESSNDEEVKRFAIELLRSQLGDEEQRLLVYICSLDENMSRALSFFSDNAFGRAGADKDSFAHDLADLVSFRLTGEFI